MTLAISLVTNFEFMSEAPVMPTGYDSGNQSAVSAGRG